MQAPETCAVNYVSQLACRFSHILCIDTGQGGVKEGDLGVHKAWWGLNSPRGLMRVAVTTVPRGIPLIATILFAHSSSR